MRIRCYGAQAVKTERPHVIAAEEQGKAREPQRGRRPYRPLLSIRMSSQTGTGLQASSGHRLGGGWTAGKLLPTVAGDGGWPAAAHSGGGVCVRRSLDGRPSCASDSRQSQTAFCRLA